MEYVNLGKTGLKVSRICLGTMTYGSPEWRDWVLGEADSLPFIKRALDSGINFFDTADMYSLGQSEVVLGNCLTKLGVRRDQVVIATKVHNPMGDDPNQRGQSRKHIRHAIEDSLRRLRVDYVDLYQIHRFDPHTPIEESLDALDGLVREGKVLYLGASSMYAWQFARLLYTADRLGLRRFVTMQNHYNLVYREEEREMNPLCEAEGVGIIPWSPLARGFLTKNRPKGDAGATVRGKSDGFSKSMYKEEADYAVVDRVSAIAAERGVSNAEVALAWLLAQRPVTAPIVGATKPEHIDAAVRATTLVLSPEERAALEQPYVPHPVLGHG
jgi:1-deoxyxylulose-5-phosphate synthase